MEQYVELNLKESETRYRRLFETAQDGILILDAVTGAITDVNPFLINLLGYSRDEFISKQLWEVGAFRDIEANREAFEALLVNEYIRYEDLPLKTKTGQLIQVEFVSNVYWVDDDQVIQCNIRDITARKLAERLSKEANENYHNLLNNMIEGCEIIDADWRYTFINDSAVKQSRKEREELIGHTMMECFPGIEKTDMFQTLKICMQEKQSSNTLYKLTYPDGEIGNFELSIQPVIGGLFILSNEVTERIKAEDDLKIAYSQLKNLNDNLPEAIFSVDVINNKTLQASPGHETVYGYDSEAFFQNPNLWREIILPEDRPLVEASIQQLSDGTILKNQYRITRKDGAIRWIETIIKPVINENGLLVRADGIASDITDNKESEKKIKRQLTHLSALSSIDRVIASNFDLKFNISQILEKVVAELEVDAASILLLNPITMVLEFGAEKGFKSRDVKKIQIKLGESYAGRAALEKRLVHVPDLKVEVKNLLHDTNLEGEGFVSYYGIPLITKGKVNGVLEILHRSILEPGAEWLDFLKTLARQTAISIENAKLNETQQRAHHELNQAYDETIEGWSAALDLRDKETEGHTKRVTESTVELASIFGITDRDLVQVRWGSLLHDIGKMGVPDAILLKPGPLTPDEWVIMKKHPTMAYELLSPIRYLRLALDIPYNHHEKWDGSGYPRGLKEEQIPLTARIFAVGDVWDALTSDRPYREAWGKQKTTEYIRSSSGKHFDPKVVAVFLASQVSM